MIRVQLPYGGPAWLATRYEDGRYVPGDLRFSRAMAVGCVGSGMCVALAPDRFVLEGPASRVVPGAGETARDELLLDVADSCPASAITVRGGRSGEVLGPRP